MTKKGRKRRDYSEIKPVLVELKRRGLKKSQALKVLREMGYKIRDKVFYELAKEIWVDEYVCADRVVIYPRREPIPKMIRIGKTNYTEKQVLKMVEDYVFEIHTEYDTVEVRHWISGKKEDKPYILTHNRLMATIVIILKHTEYLNYENFRNIVEGLFLTFLDEDVKHKKRHLQFLDRVLRILDKKEVV